jgi:N-acetylglucosaminyl-diphospho-decaprenol L-rhamnosyltransferase
MGTVDAVIVNYRTPELTVEAARSCISDALVRDVIVVDNASGDGSPQRIAQGLASDRVRLIALQDNRGFGAGNNAGAAASRAEFLFFLNSDAALTPGALGTLVHALETHPGAGVAAPRLVLGDGVTEQPGAYGKLPTPWSILCRTGGRACPLEAAEWVSGAAFLVRRELFEQLGGFDERFFLYYEDLDFCRRVRSRRLGVKVVEGATVIHKGGASQPSGREQKARYFASQDLYLKLAGLSWWGRALVKAARWPYVAFGRLFLWR